MELRHLRYFTAVVQWKGYREASRHLYITQPSISETVSDLEDELGIKLFSREGRVARLTPEGQAFYEEALKTLAQAERSIATAQRAAKGEIGRLGIGFMGFASCPFLPDLLRKYKTRYPGVSLRLEENVPSGQDLAFEYRSVCRAGNGGCKARAWAAYSCLIKITSEHEYRPVVRFLYGWPERLVSY
jgi:DNA-binding transcriptional LysR family regulator